MADAVEMVDMVRVRCGEGVLLWRDRREEPEDDVRRVGVVLEMAEKVRWRGE